MANVHEVNGDLVIVVPVPVGWGLVWYVPKNDHSEDYEDGPRQVPFSGPIGPDRPDDHESTDDDDADDEDADDEDDYDEDDYDEDDDDADDDEPSEMDVREMRLACQICANSEAKVAGDSDDAPRYHDWSYYYWESRLAAQAVADEIAKKLAHLRMAPWAEAAIRAGWTPPPDWNEGQ